jgi:hypothetical protein
MPRAVRNCRIVMTSNSKMLSNHLFVVYLDILLFIHLLIETHPMPFFAPWRARPNSTTQADLLAVQWTSPHLEGFDLR